MRLCTHGTVRLDDLYVERVSDRLLLDQLLAKEYCIVLAPRAIGKSSLMVRTAHRLRERGIACAVVSFDGLLLRQKTEGDYFHHLILCTAKALGLPEPELAADMSWPQQWTEFLCRSLRAVAPRSLVILFDEVDQLNQLGPISLDDFATLLRFLYNARVENPELERVSFGLFGTLFPSELLRNERLTPFNIGEIISLEDFKETELQAFAPIFEGLSVDTDNLLHLVYAWTAGHPRMTQRLLKRLLATLQQEAGRRLPSRDELAQWVSDAARASFLSGHAQSDLSLQRLSEWIRSTQSEAVVREMIELYEGLLDGAEVEEQAQSGVQAALWMSGLTRFEQRPGRRVLVLRNRILSSYFGREFVEHVRAEWKLTRAMDTWLRSGRKDDVLLEGKELREALAWARGAAAVTSRERQFLLLSEEREQACLTAQLETLNHQLSHATVRHGRKVVRLKRGLLTMGALSVLMASRLVCTTVHGRAEGQTAALQETARGASSADSDTLAEKADYDSRLGARGSVVVPQATIQSTSDMKAGQRGRIKRTIIEQPASSRSSEVQTDTLAAPMAVIPPPSQSQNPLAVALLRFHETPPSERVLRRQQLITELERAGDAQGRLRIRPLQAVQTAIILSDASVMAGGQDGTIYRYSGMEGTLLSQVRGASVEVTQLVAHRVASGSGQGRVVLGAKHGLGAMSQLVLWSLSTDGDRDGPGLHRLPPVPSAMADAENPVWRFTLATNGPLASAFRRDCSLVTWDPASPSVMIRPAKGQHSCREIASSPTGRWVAIGGKAGYLRLHDTVSTTEQELPGHTQDVIRLRFSRNDKRVLSVASGGKPEQRSAEWRLWDTQTRQLVSKGLFSAPALPMVDFSPDGQMFGLLAGTDTVELYDSATGQRRRSITVQPGTNLHALAFLSDNQHLALLEQSGIVSIVDTDAEMVEQKYYRATTNWSLFSISDDRNYLLTGNGRDVMYVHPLTDQSLMRTSCSLLTREQQFESLKRLCPD